MTFLSWFCRETQVSPPLQKEVTSNPHFSGLTHLRVSQGGKPPLFIFRSFGRIISIQLPWFYFVKHYLLMNWAYLKPMGHTYGIFAPCYSRTQNISCIFWWKKQTRISSLFQQSSSVAYLISLGRRITLPCRTWSSVPPTFIVISPGLPRWYVLSGAWKRRKENSI